MFPVSFISDSVTLGQAMAQAHYDRVVADGGVLPAGISGLGSVLDSVITAYGVTDSADFNTKVPVFLDPHYTGYKLGAGSGTTLGQAARTVYAISSSADVTQTTAASQPLLLAHSGDNYWWGSGVNANYCSSPITISSPYSNDFEIQINVQNSDISGTYYYQTVFSVGENFSLGIGFANNNIFVLQNGNATVQTTVGISSSIDGYYKVTKETLTYSFYSSNDAINWTLIEIVNNANMSFVFTGSNMCVGSYANATDTRANFRGKIRRIKLWIDGLSNTGTLSFDFNPATYNAATSQTQWTSATGEVWTINTGTAATGYKGVVVSKTIIQGDGVDDNIQSATFTNIVLVTLYQAKKYYPNSVPAHASIAIKAGSSGDYGQATNQTKYYASGGYFTNNIAVGSLLQLETILFKTSAQFFSQNNGAGLTIIPQTFNGANQMILFGDGSGTYMNNIFNSIAMTILEDTTIQRTAMYNIISSMNNNAF